MRNDFFLKICVSEIVVKRISFNQGTMAGLLDFCPKCAKLDFGFFARV